MEIYIYIYIYGVAVTTMANVDKATKKEFSVAIILAVLWPVYLPSRIVRKLTH